MAPLDTDVYASSNSKFIVINNTNSNLDSVINKLVVNTQSVQPLEFIDNNTNLLKLPGSHSSGLIFNKALNTFNITMLYNDSALLSIPYLLHTVNNLISRIDNTDTIKASITSFPNVNCEISVFDSASFTSELMFGIAIILPSVTFAVEIVYDKEVLRLSR